MDFLVFLLGIDFMSILGRYAKECQQASLTTLLGHKPGSDVKKCQQAFLAPLPGKALVKRT